MKETEDVAACCNHMSDAQIKHVEEIIGKHCERKGALIPILQDIQTAFGYLPEWCLRRTASALGISFSEVAGVTGFYSFFSTVPRGKFTIRVCLGTACYVLGGKRVLEALEKELGISVGETTGDGMFTLESARCFGTCGLAPVLSVGESIHERVKPEDVRHILEIYREQEL